MTSDVKIDVVRLNVQGGLFSHPPDPEDPCSPDHVGVIAARKAGVTGWEWCRMEVVGKDDLLVEGGVPRVLQSGPRRGHRTWRDADLTRVVVTATELAAERERYEREDGKCHTCGGHGRVLQRWSKVEGLTFKKCQRCGATGKPPTPPEVAT